MMPTTFHEAAALSDNIEAVVLFGSRARGDSDDASDTDVAVFAFAHERHELAATKAQLAETFPGPTFSIYSTATGQNMALGGSLFLWHLKTEGQVLLDCNGWYADLLTMLQPYSKVNAQRDVRTFECACRDILENIGHGATVLYEAATLFSILRSLGMIYCARRGEYVFSRTLPVQVLQQAELTRVSETDFSFLARCRHLYARNIPAPPEIDEQVVRRLALDVLATCNEVGRICQ